jgi:hypothetical protein
MRHGVSGSDEGGRRRVMLGPHPEERALARVSKDGCESMYCVHPSRRGQKAAPQNEVDRYIAEKKFSFSLKLIWVVQSSSQKYFHCRLRQITC